MLFLADLTPSVWRQ